MPTSPPAPQRVLFVDDEPSILKSLARLLRPLRAEIECEFAGSGAEALARLAVEPFDIVVTDMRMPVMDGLALLAQLQRLHPHIIRVALSGHTDMGDAMKAVKVAHQFLAKPCDAETMRSVLLRAAGLHALLCDRALQTLAASMRDIPSRPETYTALSERLADPNATSGQIAKLIARDVGMAASLLKIVNSAFFGSPRRVTSIESAINYLGTSMLSSVILANAATSALGPRAREHGYDLELSGTHALLSANLAMRMFTEKAAREDAFAAGLLQNIGELLLVAIGPDTALVAMAHAKAHGKSLEVAERELGVVSHAHVGAYLLGAWGLPYGIVEAVAHHHEPQAIKHAALELVDAVHVGALVADHYLLQREDSLLRARQHLAAIGAEARFAPLEAAAERLMSKEPP